MAWAFWLLIFVVLYAECSRVLKQKDAAKSLPILIPSSQQKENEVIPLIRPSNRQEGKMIFADSSDDESHEEESKNDESHEEDSKKEDSDSYGTPKSLKSTNSKLQLEEFSEFKNFSFLQFEEQSVTSELKSVDTTSLEKNNDEKSKKRHTSEEPSNVTGNEYSPSNQPNANSPATNLLTNAPPYSPTNFPTNSPDAVSPLHSPNGLESWLLNHIPHIDPASQNTAANNREQFVQFGDFRYYINEGVKVFAADEYEKFVEATVASGYYTILD